VVSFAEVPGGGPNWILPIATIAAQSVSDVLDFDYLMWRPLYWPDQGVSAAIDPTLSLARPPAWSSAGTTATITMSSRYTWSDGKPLSAQDGAFDIDLIKAAIKENSTNWADYQPGFFPDDVASVSTPNDTTLVLNLKSPVNPSWFYEDELEALQPLPAHAWAKASASGPLLDYTDPDSLINASVNSSNPDAVKSEAVYLTAQQPALFQASADVVFAWKKTLSGPPRSFANLTQYYMTPESWYFTK